MNKFVFIKDGCKREIHMRAFIDSVPKYVLNHSIFSKENISAYTIKEFGKYILSILSSFNFYKPDLPFNTSDFEELSIKYGLIDNQIKNINYFYNCGNYDYSKNNIESLIQVMKNMVYSIMLRNDESDVDILHKCIDDLEQWYKYEFSIIGWQNEIESIDETVYLLLHDIGTTFLHSGAEDYSGYWI
jgi:hypothetical protein